MTPHTSSAGRSLTVVVNPTAGRGAAARALPQVKELLARRFPGTVVVHATSARGDAGRIAREALSAGADIIAAMGGDGTLHEVANAMLSKENQIGDASLMLIPFGTGNDFARAVGLRGTLELIVAVATHGERRMIDVGAVDSPSLNGFRLFLVAAGVGFVADTAYTVNSGIRLLTGPAAYVYGALKTLRRFVSVDATLSFDGGETKPAELSLISVSNVATTGGGIKIAPDALPDDGRFDVCVVGSMSKLRLIGKLPLAFTGRHVADPSVSMVRCSSVSIVTEKPCALWIDGEVTGTTPVTFRIMPAALPMLLPPRSSSP